MATHSEKALATLTALNIPAEQWKLTEIKWVKEEREIPGQVRCPVCLGGKNVVINPDGTVVPPVVNTKKYGEEGYFEGYEAEQQYDRAARKCAREGMYQFGNCPRCRGKQRGYTVAFGTVKGIVKAKVMVGYPQWKGGEATKFDSRFARGCACHLCNKTVLKSGRVPVEAQDAQGNWHGMWLGQDCAKKFLSVTVATAEKGTEQVMEG